MICRPGATRSGAPGHPVFASAWSSQDVLRCSGRRVVALELLSLSFIAAMGLFAMCYPGARDQRVSVRRAMVGSVVGRGIIARRAGLPARGHAGHPADRVHVHGLVVPCVPRQGARGTVVSPGRRCATARLPERRSDCNVHGLRVGAEFTWRGALCARHWRLTLPSGAAGAMAPRKTSPPGIG